MNNCKLISNNMKIITLYMYCCSYKLTTLGSVAIIGVTIRKEGRNERKGSKSQMTLCRGQCFSVPRSV